MLLKKDLKSCINGKKICFRKGVLQAIVGIVATWTSFLFPFPFFSSCSLSIRFFSPLF